MFSVTHEGRGGRVRCGDRTFEIEHVGGGVFSVYLRGLAATERQALERELRAWLDATGRERWVIE